MIIKQCWAPVDCGRGGEGKERRGGEGGEGAEEAEWDTVPNDIQSNHFQVGMSVRVGL